MSDTRKRIAVLGAGPAGLALGMKLLRRKDLNCEVEVIDLKPYVGGLSASFERDGLYFDHGSHRLHPATSNEIMSDIRGLLGDDLLERPRNGRISLLGRFVKFPLNPLNLAMHLPPSFMAGFVWDMLSKPLRKKHVPQESFADALMDGLGKTICHEFYFPYARKLWGMEPEEISVIQAQKRVSADNLLKIIGKVFSLFPGVKKEGAGKFYYPVKGYGQISDVVAAEVARLGGHLRLSTLVREIHRLEDGRLKLISTPVTLEENGKPETAGAEEERIYDFVFSTIPVTILASLLRPEIPEEISNASKRLKYRGMVIHYLILSKDQFSPYDAHYFPGEDVIFSRLSEPKNYSNSSEPKGRTGLCFEIPCKVGDDIWRAPGDLLTEQVCSHMKHVKLPIEKNIIKSSFSRRIPQVYPIYDKNFENSFQQIDDHLTSLRNLVPLGRQALFAHDNTHHTMEMAYRASDCLGKDFKWNSKAWTNHRLEFEKHVVVD